MKNTNTSKQNSDTWPRRFTPQIVIVLLIALFGLPAAIHAMTNTIQYVKVGDTGNPPDARTGGTNGSVAYSYYISKYPIRNDQYAEFLNDVASATDTFGLGTGHDQARGGFTKTVTSSNILWGTKLNYDNKPVNWVTFDMGCRFCNWLHNGGIPGADTENGAYNMSLSPNQVRIPGARYFLPNKDEWVKAAFYQPGILSSGTNAGYWNYATRNDNLPGGGYADAVGNITNGPNNVANWEDPNTGPFTWDSLSPNASTVGSAGSGSVSYYGAYDMNGNVYQWTETMNPAGTKRSYFGGSMFSGAGELPSTLNYTHPITGGPPGGWWDDPTVQAPSLGFRVCRAAAPAVEFVIVGDVGNPPDARTGGTNGSVSYVYAISKYPIRTDQYVEYLDNVASPADPNNVHSGVGGTRGGVVNFIGAAGDRSYGTLSNYDNKPVNWTLFDQGCRFCNYLHNGAVPGANTEDGAYDMSLSPNQVRKPGAKYFLPTQNEWYKAAFYEPGIMSLGSNPNYWLYATRHDTLPGGGYADAVGNITNGPNNVANWEDPNTGPFTWDNLSPNASTVGSAGSNSATRYGAYDMNGNVYQWTETMNPAGTKRSYHGGSMFSGAGELPSTLNLTAPITGGPPSGYWDDPSVQAPSLGFRVATVVLPDPGIVQEPTNTTAGPGGTATFVVVPTGTSPFTYQWQANGTNITRVVATNASLVLTNVQTTDAGTYTVIVSNSVGYITSYPAAILTVDTIPPTLVNAIGSLSNNTIVTVTFSKKLDPTTATNKNNYSINNGVVITSATLNADGLTVVLTTSPISSVCPILTVNSVQSSVGLPIAPNSQILVSVPNGTVHFQDNSSDNLLVLEAENYTFNQPGGGQAWTFTTVPPFLIPTATDTNVSGSGCMVALPNFGISYSFNPGDRPSGIPELDYVVNFTTTGTNYIWVRGSGDSDVGGANDSINLGLDGAIAYRINGVFPQAAGYAWGNTPTPATGVFTNATAGLHIINCWMREDGFGFDKLVLSSNPNYNPTGIGPAESVVQTVIGFIRSGNNVSLCWAGGGTLQASPAVSGTYTNVPNATSPYTFAPSGGQLYFRIH